MFYEDTPDTIHVDNPDGSVVKIEIDTTLATITTGTTKRHALRLPNKSGIRFMKTSEYGRGQSVTFTLEELSGLIVALGLD